MRDGHSSELRIVEPISSTSSNNPLIVLYFGGGFITGSNHQLLPYAYTLCSLLTATIVLPTYRLAPEHPFPTGSHDSYDTLLWLSTHASDLNADLSSGFIVGGVSAGANMAACSIQKYVTEDKTPKVSGMWMCIPSVLSDLSVPEHEKHLYLSREQCATGVGLDADAIERITKAYNADYYSEMQSPFNAKVPHKGMPRTFLQVAGGGSVEG